MDWIDNGRSLYKVFGTKRINLLLGIGKDHYKDEYIEELAQIRTSRFGLGNKRTLEQAVDFFGIDFENRKMVANKCGNLIWVPFIESEDYGVPETLERLPKHSMIQRLLPEDVKTRSLGTLNAPQLVPSSMSMVNQLAANATYTFYEYAMVVFCCIIMVPRVRRYIVRRHAKQPRHTI
jgi:hypothetical protein